MALATRMSAAECLATHEDHPERRELIDGAARLEVAETEVLTSPPLPGFALEVRSSFGR
ncbi:MAG: hypothetical protein KY438_02830 [Actinobacteria bacterium]|nr:hypothetical protein [Actinomycetota bacterium]